jgi:phospholipid-binding lipoprotein MlaA
MTGAAHLRRWLGLLLLVAAGLLGGCATVPGEGVSKVDPWEPMNRKVFAFNEAVDQAAIKPAALIYQNVVPNFVRTAVGNVFGNLGDIWTTANLVLQLKPKLAVDMGARALINTTFGIGGLLDVADEAGLERKASEDFGQTLGFWGLKSGPYVVLPIIGPATLRDATGLALDLRDSGPSRVWKEPRDRNAASSLQVLDTRVKLLNAGRVLDDIALDKYVLLRDAYLARRRSLIYDGDPPEEENAPPPYKAVIKRESSDTK